MITSESVLPDRPHLPPHSLLDSPAPSPMPHSSSPHYDLDGFKFNASKSSWTSDKEKAVRAPFDYITSHPGKDFRAMLIGAFNSWLNVPSESLEIITRVIGMLHESSLLIDDVQDDSDLRRGAPVAHHIYGVAQTINAANYVYFSALQEIFKLRNSSAAVSIFTEELINLHRGQGMDLYWRDALICPSEDDYLEMVANKTGGLFRLGIRLMQAESASEIDCMPLVDLVGLIFQIRDDYMNLSSKEYSDNKGMYEDLTEGKFSFPIIHSIQKDPSNLRLVHILKQKTKDVELKRHAVKYIEGMGSFKYTQEVLKVLIEKAKLVAKEIDQGRDQMGGIQMILDRVTI
ncbi:hypothetical protein S40288_07365 [Stachybotrys chartarum IBT 40288]|nr:hypothetical protein S40288_07365 [Stachybotrys chartarum IBT 40288]